MATPTRTLSPACFHILLVLADGYRHGLAIMDEAQRRTQGAVRLGPGILYGSIKKLLQAGLIEESKDRPHPSQDDSRRRYYSITASGRRALQEELESLSRILDIAREKSLIQGKA